MPFQPQDKQQRSIVKQCCGSPATLPFQDKCLALSSTAKGPVLYFPQSKEAACPETVTSSFYLERENLLEDCEMAVSPTSSL